MSQPVPGLGTKMNAVMYVSERNKMELEKHFDHDIVIAKYTDGIVEPSYAVECETCFEVIIDDEAYAQLIPPF